MNNSGCILFVMKEYTVVVGIADILPEKVTELLKNKWQLQWTSRTSSGPTHGTFLQKVL